jgi:hypothetical protein
MSDRSAQEKAKQVLARREKRWEEGYRLYEITKELRRAQFRSLIRLVGRGLGVLNPAKGELVRAAFMPAGEAFKLPIDQVVGFVDEQTGRRRKLLLSGDSMARLWMRIYAREDGDHQPLLVAETEEGWDLVGGTASLVRLEVLRAKGECAVKAVRMDPEDDRLCPGCQGCLASDCPADGSRTRATA